MTGEVFNNLASMSMLIIVGYFLKIKEESLEDISSIVVDVCMPALILYSTITTFSKETFQQALSALGFGIIAALLGLLFGTCMLRVLKVDKEQHLAFLITSSFGNTGFIGMPLMMMIFGKEGLLLAIFFDFGMNIVLWSVGIALLQKKKVFFEIDSIKNLINPLIISIIIGFIVGMLEIEIPYIVSNFLSSLGSIAPTIAMIFVGLMLKPLEIKKLKYNKDIFGLVVVKLILVPLTIYLILEAINSEKILTSVILLQSAMPCMASAPIIIKRFQGNSTYAAMGVLLSTLMFLIIILPLLATII